MPGIGFPFRDRARPTTDDGTPVITMLDRRFAYWVNVKPNPLADVEPSQLGFDPSQRWIDWRVSPPNTKPIRVRSSHATGVVAAMDTTGVTASVGLDRDGNVVWSMPAFTANPAVYAWSDASDYIGAYESLGTELAVYRVDGSSLVEVFRWDSDLTVDGWTIERDSIIDFAVGSSGEYGAALCLAEKDNDLTWAVIGGELATGDVLWIRELGPGQTPLPRAHMQRIPGTDDLILAAPFGSATPPTEIRFKVARVNSNDALATTPSVSWSKAIETGEPLDQRYEVLDSGIAAGYFYVAHTPLRNGKSLTAVRLSTQSVFWQYAPGGDAFVTGVDSDGRSVCILVAGGVDST